jgi:type IV pilus assembly protein PilB
LFNGSFAVKFHNRTIELRVSVCPTVFGEKLVLRILDKGTSELNIDKLGFEPRQKKDFLEASNFPHGLFLQEQLHYQLQKQLLQNLKLQ